MSFVTLDLDLLRFVRELELDILEVSIRHLTHPANGLAIVTDKPIVGLNEFRILLIAEVEELSLGLPTFRIFGVAKEVHHVFHGLHHISSLLPVVLWSVDIEP